MLRMFMENNEKMNSRDRQFKNKGKGKANWKRIETEVEILRFSECPGGQLLRGTEYSAGYDLKSAKSGLLRPNERKAFRSGIGFVLPWNGEAQIRPRSGLALNRGITVFNSPGTIDPDYRGEVKVILVKTKKSNMGKELLRWYLHSSEGLH